MTLRHIRIFTAVCKYGSITAAAEKLYLAQPTVSLAIKELERGYGVRLFDRIGKKLYLTEPGKQFLNYAEHLCSLYDEMERKIRNRDSSDTFRVGASITIGICLLPKYAAEFRRTHPGIKIQAVIDDSRRIEKKVMENSVDFALIEGIVHNRQISSREFLRDRLVLICGKDQDAAGKGSLKPEDLPKYSWILREKGSGTREYFDSILTVNNICIRPEWESVSTQAILEAVHAGLGLSVLPYRLAKRDLDAGRVVEIPVSGISFSRPYYIIYHQNKFLTQSAREFIDLILDGQPQR